MLSIPHMIVVFIVVLVVFGPQKLPELARSLGKLMAEFRKASTDFKSAFEEEMRDLERQALVAERKKAAEAAATSVAVEPSQPAALGAPTGTETPSTEARADSRASEPPVMTPSIRPEPVPDSTPNTQITAPDDEPGGAMTFFEHLSELRKRIIYSLYAIGVGTFVGVYLSKYFIYWINKPMLKALADAHLDPKLIYTHPAGYLNLIITIGVYLGIVLASPIVLYQIWLFVAPALYKHERGAITGFMFSTVFLFLAGITFGYFITLPYVLHFLVSPGSLFMLQRDVVPMISVNEYFDLILLILLGMGLMFELPVLIFFLSLFGIVTPKFLWRNFRYAILIIAIVAAIVTPTPDAMTMLIFMAPMVGLYFVGIAVSAIVTRRRERRLATPAEAR